MFQSLLFVFAMCHSKELMTWFGVTGWSSVVRTFMSGYCSTILSLASGVQKRLMRMMCSSGTLCSFSTWTALHTLLPDLGETDI